MENITYAYLALGDSYTVGELVASSQRWPNQLVQLFALKDVKIFTPISIAHSGFTTGELLQSLKQFDIQGKFDLVSLQIGVNNQYRNYAIDIYKNEFAELIRYAISKSKDSKNVFVVSIPDWGCTPFGEKDPRGGKQISQEIDRYNEIAKEICDSYHIRFLDITPISRNFDPSFWATDQLHPSGLQYKRWAEYFFECIGGGVNLII